MEGFNQEEYITAIERQLKGKLAKGVSAKTVSPESPKAAESSAERFAKAVVRRNINGKLPSGVIVGDKKLIDQSGGFFDHGPDIIKLDPAISAKTVTGFHQSISERQQPDLIRSQIVTIRQSEADPNNKIITIYFFQDANQVDSRGHCTPALVSAELPCVTMDEFAKEITQDPDLLENFYQKTFPGLDSQGGLPGMRRIKTDGFYLLSGSKLNEARQIGISASSAVGNFLKSLEKYQYIRGPYGTGDAFQPR